MSLDAFDMNNDLALRGCLGNDFADTPRAVNDTSLLGFETAEVHML